MGSGLLSNTASRCGRKTNPREDRALIKITSLSRFALLIWAPVACDQSQPEISLEGQWVVEFQESGRKPPSVPTAGVLIFSRELPHYPGETEEFPPGAEIGRAFVPLASLSGQRVSGEDKHFGAYAGADRAETIWGQVVGQDSVQIDLAPHVNDFDPVLRGQIVNGTINGEWTIHSSGVPVRTGQFRMMRVPRDAWSDSAHVRAHREVRRWSAD